MFSEVSVLRVDCKKAIVSNICTEIMKRSRESDHDAFTYVEHVKDILGNVNRDIFYEFLQVVKKAKTDVEEAKCRLKELFHGKRDLILGFNAFIPNGFQITFDEEPRKKKQKNQESYRAGEVIDLLNNLKLLIPNLYMEFLNVLRDHQKEERPIEEVNNVVSELLQNHPDLFKKFISFQSDSENDITERVPERGGNQSIGFLERLSVKGENPSYVRNNKPLAHNKSKLVSQVINQILIIKEKLEGESESDKNEDSRTSDSRTSEEDLYEADMQLDVVTSTKERVECLVEEIKTDPSLKVVKHLRGSNLRCIEHLYGEHGGDVIDLLRKEATAALTLGVLSDRLQQKRQECTEFREQLRKAQVKWLCN